MGLTRIFPVCSPLTAEALAIRDAVTLAINCSMDKVVVESDCLQLVRACRKEIILGEIQGIVTDINSYRDIHSKCGITWTPREGNAVAHHIALLESQQLLPLRWFWNPPLQAWVISCRLIN